MKISHKNKIKTVSRVFLSVQVKIIVESSEPMEKETKKQNQHEDVIYLCI